MDPIRIAIERPVAVIAAVMMAVMFGALALARIPIQLTPDVRKPVIEVTTVWAGAAPAEVEREIINPQEDEIKGLSGLETIISTADTGRARITLEFAIGTDMDRAFTLVANRLDRVSGYPAEAEEPTLDTSGSDDNPIAWMIVRRAEGVTRPMEHYGDFVNDVVAERLERVDGVAATNVYGGVERELQVIIDPEELARFRLTIPEVVEVLRRESISLSAGDLDEGKRRYVVRAEGELNTVAAVEEVVLRSGAAGTADALGRVFMRDVSEIRFGHKEPTARIRQNGQAAIAVNAVREQGANVIETMEGIRAAITELRDGPLAAEGLTLTQVYDETVYIDGAIDLVIQNIWVGGLLAAGVLLLFLRSGSATLVISLAIPVSIVASFVAMAALGRTLNVISLAGIAFAVGMVVDAAIVVLENIYRLRQLGVPSAQAAYEGARQVWGAILVSALTTVMVFIPILVMELEAGQLFRDLAVAISVSVCLSLVVAVTVIPALSARLLGRDEAQLSVMPVPIVDHFGRLFAWIVRGYAWITVKVRLIGLLVVSAITGAALWGAAEYLPKLEYLPEGNRNLVFGVTLPPPGYNLATTTEIAERIEAVARPLWQLEDDGTTELPGIRHFFFVAVRGSTFLGGSAQVPGRVAELIPVLRAPIFAEPGTFGFINQRSLFGRGIGGGRAIELNVQGQDLEEILGVAQRAAGKIVANFPPMEDNQFRPIPGLELGAPEVRMVPDRVHLADAGIDARTLAQTLDAYNDGLRIAEITVGSERIDLTLLGTSANEEGRRTQDIGGFPVVAPNGRIVPLSALSSLELTAGPTQIRHRERLRTVTLELRPSTAIPLETALEMMAEDVVGALRAEGLPPGVQLSLSGAADQLTQTWEALQVNLLLALVIVFLVMAVLFESFILPLVILISVPVAGAGGVAGLVVLNQFQAQSLDMLTLLGFVILIGIVVNNAILLVHQSLYHLREEGMGVDEAILEATRNRIRPIFMSTLTSVMGMLPLVVFPGAGSELYRGLGSVVVGGLSMSAVLTLLLVPPLLRLTLGVSERHRAAPAEIEDDAGDDGYYDDDRAPGDGYRRAHPAE
ncbi:efflux RND transporter permease subunit [Paralimibaculum aggregatum]|uniref:Efflux RND transporter permease subunit n=1 Tax=Paralimibaculum aggregatum TaxID=3036245 RepID=A0ABQ6LJA0_9RHOB|nr:efflux RND transporter permease subunit [Limibaculum sp. NKW23]GMG82310.1 efflux RND transporter permease subunit [Limibaculum sp. NKW23]